MVVIGDSGGNAGRCANYGISSVHAQRFSHGKVEQMIMTSLHDVTVIAHAIRVREVYKES